MGLLCFFHCYDTAWPDRRRSAKKLCFPNGMFLDVYLENSKFPPMLPKQTNVGIGPVVSLTIEERLYGGVADVLYQGCDEGEEVHEGRGLAS